MTMKQCTKCRELKDLSEFHKKRNGLQPVCKSCQSKYLREYNERNADRIKLGKQKWGKDNRDKNRIKRKEYRNKNRDRHNKWVQQHRAEASPDVRLRRKLSDKASNLKRAGVEIDATAMKALGITAPKKCPCCGSPFKYSASLSPFSPSVDCIDNVKGYVGGNMAIICFGCNAAKGQSSLEELKERGKCYAFIARYVERHLHTAPVT